MSNDLLREEGFFANKNIPDCEKLGLIALIGCGSYDQQMNETGIEKAFGSWCPKSGGGAHFIAFTYGRPESLTPMAVTTNLHAIGFKDAMIDSMFKSMSDEEVINNAVNFFRVARNTDKTKQPDTYSTLVEPKLARYLENLRVTDGYLTNNPRILDNVKTYCQMAYGASNEKSNEDEKNPEVVLEEVLAADADFLDDGKKKL